MKSPGTIFRREFAAYFNSPVAYVFIIVFLLITSGLYMSTFFLLGRATMRNYFDLLPVFLAVFVPALTMRLWAEERKLGTISLLLSFPMKSHTLVLGKFLAVLAFYLIVLASTGMIPLTLGLLGEPDWGPIITGYVGAALTGCFFLSIGMFVSALFKDQILAFILGILVCFTSSLLGTDFVAAFLDGWVGGLGQALRKGFGALYHFAGFERGLINISDVIFFVGFTVVFLLLNSFTLDTRIKLRSPGRFYVATVILVCLGFVLNLWASDERLGRLDLTEDRVHMISPAAREVLSRLRAPVTVDYYVSERDKLPSILKDIRREVEDKLSDYARLSPNFKYHVYNPLADPEKLEELGKKGIVPFQAQSIEQDSLDIKRVYSSIAITYLDKKTEVIPQVVPQTLGNLEYELISGIHRMTSESPPVIAMVAPIEGADPRYSDPAFREMLLKMGQTPPTPQDHFRGCMQLLQREGYRVARIALSREEPLPEGTVTLLIMQPEALNERQIYEIQRFLSEGGNVLVIAQANAFNYMPSRAGGLQVAPLRLPGSVDRLIEPYGIRVDGDILMDTEMEILNVQFPQRIGGLFNAMVSTPVKLPIQIRVPDRNLNSEVSITNRIGGLLYLWGSPLITDAQALEKNELKTTVLARSSPSSWTVPFSEEPLTRNALQPPPESERSPRSVALLIEGSFPDTFTGRDIPFWPEESQDSAERPEGEPRNEKAPPAKQSPGRLIVVGCSQMFADNALGALDNALFFQNMVDALSLDVNLVGIRTKTRTIRFLSPTSTGEKLFYRFLVMALVPLVLAAIGVFRYGIRRRRREIYERRFSSAT